MTAFTTLTSQISNHFCKLAGWLTPGVVLAKETTTKTGQAAEAAFENLSPQNGAASIFDRLGVKTLLAGTGFAIASLVIYTLSSQDDGTGGESDPSGDGLFNRLKGFRIGSMFFKDASEAICAKLEWEEWNPVSVMMCKLWDSMKHSDGQFSKDQDHQAAEKSYNQFAQSTHNLVKIMVNLLRELKQQQLTGSNLDDQAAKKLFKEVHRQLGVLNEQLDKAPCKILFEEKASSMKWVVQQERHQALWERLNQLKMVVSYVEIQWEKCKDGQGLLSTRADTLIALSESPLSLRITKGLQALCKLKSNQPARHCYKHINDIIEHEMDTLLLLFHLGVPALNAWRNFSDFISSGAIKTTYQDVLSEIKGKNKRTSGRKIEREQSKSIEPVEVEIIGSTMQHTLKKCYDMLVRMESRRRFEAAATRTKPTNQDERLTQINEACSTEKGFSLRLKILKTRLEKVQGRIENDGDFQSKLQKWCKENKADGGQLVDDLDNALKLINAFTDIQSKFMNQLEEASKADDEAVEKYCQCMEILAAPYCDALVPLIAMQKQGKLDLLAKAFSGNCAIGGADISTIRFSDYPELDALIKLEQKILAENLEVAQTNQRKVEKDEQAKWGKIVSQLSFEAIPALKNLAEQGGSNPLTGFTILPVQRWPRIGLYLKEVIKATNKDSAKEIELLRTASLAVDKGGFCVNLS